MPQLATVRTVAVDPVGFEPNNFLLAKEALCHWSYRP